MKFRNKFILFVLVVGGFGAFMYQAGRDDLLSFEWRREETPKILTAFIRKPTVTKPLRLTSRKNEHPEAVGKPVAARFTFFETLRDTQLTSYVDLNGKVVRDAAPALSRRPAPPLVKKSTTARANPQPALPVEPHKSAAKTESAAIANPKPTVPAASRQAAATSKPPPSPVTPIPVTPVAGNKGDTEKAAPGFEYWVQVSSFRQARRAEALELKLKSKGYPAFVVPREVPGKGLWHRVYLGRFGGRELAEKAAGQARRQERLNPVIVQSALSSK
ncbi:MAG: SPOR domain-containing protein [Nitrospinaceae bacterium]